MLITRVNSRRSLCWNKFVVLLKNNIMQYVIITLKRHVDFKISSKITSLNGSQRVKNLSTVGGGKQRRYLLSRDTSSKWKSMTNKETTRREWMVGKNHEWRMTYAAWHADTPRLGQTIAILRKRSIKRIGHGSGSAMINARPCEKTTTLPPMKFRAAPERMEETRYKKCVGF